MPHLEPISGLSVRQSVLACYPCRAVAATDRSVHKSVASVNCSCRTFQTVSVQTLKRGNKVFLFPVAFVRPATVDAAAGGGGAPSSASAPAAVVPAGRTVCGGRPASTTATALSADVFLVYGAENAASHPCGPLQTSVTATDDSQSGGLLQYFCFHTALDKAGWSPLQVVETFDV